VVRRRAALLGRIARRHLALAANETEDAEAAEETSKLIKYLQRHHGRWTIEFAHKGGYSAGVGGIESVHKFICHAL
jgi:hypothetical protein